MAPPEPSAPPPGKLLHILGIGFGIAVTMGGTIGVGILRTPGSIAGQLGSPALILGLWIFGGLYVLLGALSVAELGTSLPRAGGWYVYARRAFGDYAGFIAGWTNWLAYCAVLGSLTISVGEFAGRLVPGLVGHARAIAIATLAVFTLLQWRSVKTGSRIQQVMAALAAVAFLALVVACFLIGPAEAAVPAEAAPVRPPATLFALLAAFVLSFQAVLFTYDGWYGAIFFSEEVSDPARQLPRSMVTGVLAIITLYVLVNLALLYVVPLPLLATSDLAAADAARIVFGAGSDRVITMLSFLSVLSVTNATLLMSSRILFGLSRDGLFAARFAAVNPGGTPTLGLLASTAVAIVLVTTGTFEQLIAVTSFLYVLLYASGFVALLVLRKKEPGLPRPFRVPGYPWTPALILFLSAIFFVGVLVADTRNSLYGVGLLLLGYPVYRLTLRGAAGRPS